MNIEKLLENIQKPGRYIGEEWNAARGDFDSAKVRIVLCFPDAYEVGMSHLGFKILYHLLNEQPGVVCERAFMPWFDMEEKLRKEGIALFSLESKRPLSDFDIVGFSLEHELNYTNVLAMLSLSGIPLKSQQRNDKFPLILAGGICSVNPEPMADFFDAFFIGEAEEGILEIVEILRRHCEERRAKARSDEANSLPQGDCFAPEVSGARKDVLMELAKIEGVYVPSFYDVAYNDEGVIKSFKPKYDCAPDVIKKRVVKDFENSYYPVKQIVPYVQIIHDRISLEIMRGCPNACNFCQATSVYKPLRLRSADRIFKLAEEAAQATGYDEISLVSLSSGDHPQILEIVKGLTARFSSRKLSISLPSLRAEDVLKALPQLISSIKKTGLTFAPEAGSQRLRDFINKRLDIEKLYECASSAAKNGWRRLKLYFMIGLPSETDEDLAAIKDLVSRISRLSVTVSISFFVPKPHTKFEKEPMADMDTLKNKQAFLEKTLRLKGVQVKWHNIQMGFLEAVLSRGDRRISDVILRAYEHGARFDSWSEGFKSDIWQASFKEQGLNTDFYLYRKMNPGDILPWSHICIASYNSMK